MITRRTIVTNNPKVRAKYRNVEVFYLEGKTICDVLLTTRDLLENGARLTRAEIPRENKRFLSVSLFYGDPNAPIKRNLTEVSEALEAATKRAERANRAAFPWVEEIADLKQVPFDSAAEYSQREPAPQNGPSSKAQPKTKERKPSGRPEVA